MLCPAGYSVMSRLTRTVFVTLGGPLLILASALGLHGPLVIRPMSRSKTD